jgi:hypothetical protein
MYDAPQHKRFTSRSIIFYAPEPSPSEPIASTRVDEGMTPLRPPSWTPEELPVDSSEHQHDADIHCQPFPESVSQEREIDTDDDGCHHHHVKHYGYLSAHLVLSCSRTCWPILSFGTERSELGDTI